MELSNYTVTNDISEATAWLSLPDPQSVVKDYITPNKLYEIIKIKDQETEEDEFYIESEDGFNSMYYACHKGIFIKGELNGTENMG